MKKVLTIAAFAGMLAFVACGPSQADLDKAKKMHDDSVAAADSMTAAADAAAMKQKATADSIHNVELMMKAKDSLHQDSIDHKWIKVKK